MAIKQMIFAVMIFMPTNSFTQYNSKDFVFGKRIHTQINGNSLFTYLYSEREQENPSYVFKHTRVVECTKDKKLTEVATLGAMEKSYRLRHVYNVEVISLDIINRFRKFGDMNNAIYCADIEQKLNYYDELEDVGAIVYGTRDVNDCALLREFLKQQEIAAKK